MFDVVVLVPEEDPFFLPVANAAHFTWVNSMEYICVTIDKAILLVKEIERLQQKKQCPCRTKLAQDLKNAVSAAMLRMEFLCWMLPIGHMLSKPLAEANYQLIVVSEFVSKALNAQQEPFLRRAAAVPYRFLMGSFENFYADSIIMEELKFIRRLGRTPKLVQCHCHEQMNSLAILGQLDSAKRNLVASMFMASIALHGEIYTCPEALLQLRVYDVERTPLYSCSMLHYSVYLTVGNDLMEVINCGLDVDARDSMGLTPLHMATLLEDAETMRVLLKADASLEVVDNVGNTALHTAIAADETNKVELLLKVPAAVKTMFTSNGHGYSPLQLALSMGRNKLIDALLFWYFYYTN